MLDKFLIPMGYCKKKFRVYSRVIKNSIYYLQSASTHNKSSGNGRCDGSQAVAGSDAVIGAPRAAPQGVPAGQPARQVMRPALAELLARQTVLAFG